MKEILDKNGIKIKPGIKVKFKRPFWDNDGKCEIKETIQTVSIDEYGEMFANNSEDDIFYVDWSEMQV